ncbi:glycosyltransferase [Methanolobus sp. WCC5]|uniref:glycosyltransferase n=1 Tax=Methanolobus sp. WCC5 TaxID=3125785 RepID=UPI003248D4D6
MFHLLEELDISVVIITRNEEENIEECIKSVICAVNYAREKKLIQSYEIILVDSDSSDNTVRIASNFPLKIIQLKKSMPLSAGAGMFVGTIHSKGKFLAKVDGDSVLYEDWFANSIPYFNQESIAGVTGIYVEEVNTTNSISKAYSQASKNQHLGEIDVIATGLFKKSILYEVGLFNPFLKAAEDRDISWKITEKGYKLLKIPYFEMRHYIANRSKELTYREHFKKMYIYSVGEGHAARYALKDKKLLKKYIVKYFNINFAKVYISILLWINVITANYLLIKVSYFPEYLLLINLLLFILFLFILLVRLKSKSLDKLLFSYQAYPYVLIRQYGFFRGLLKSPKGVDQYPLDLNYIKQ